MNTLGSRIREIRKRKHISQEELANVCGLSTKSAVSSWERDKTQPNVEQLIKISKITGQSLDWLIAGEFYQPHDPDYRLDYQPEINRAPKCPAIPIETSIPVSRSDISTMPELEYFNYTPDTHRFLLADYEVSESIIPLVKPGDLVLLDLYAPVKDGDIVAARWSESKGALKICNFSPTEPDCVLLSAFNSIIPTFTFQLSQIVMYKVVFIKKK